MDQFLELAPYTRMTQDLLSSLVSSVATSSYQETAQKICKEIRQYEKYDVTALGKLLIDFTENGKSNQGNPLFDPNLRPTLWKYMDEARRQVLYGMEHCHILKISDNEIRWSTGNVDICKCRSFFGYHS